MKTVYTTIIHKNNTYSRLVGKLDDDSDMVMVHTAKGKRLGGFLLSRFDGGKLTAKTLNKLFTSE